MTKAICGLLATLACVCATTASANYTNLPLVKWSVAGWYQGAFGNIFNIGEEYMGTVGGPFADEDACRAALPPPDEEDRQARISYRCAYLTKDPDVEEN